MLIPNLAWSPCLFKCCWYLFCIDSLWCDRPKQTWLNEDAWAEIKLKSQITQEQLPPNNLRSRNKVNTAGQFTFDLGCKGKEVISGVSPVWSWLIEVELVWLPPGVIMDGKWCLVWQYHSGYRELFAWIWKIILNSLKLWLLLCKYEWFYDPCQQMDKRKKKFQVCVCHEKTPDRTDTWLLSHFKSWLLDYNTQQLRHFTFDLYNLHLLFEELKKLRWVTETKWIPNGMGW